MLFNPYAPLGTRMSVNAILPFDSHYKEMCDLQKNYTFEEVLTSVLQLHLNLNKMGLPAQVGMFHPPFGQNSFVCTGSSLAATC